MGALAPFVFSWTPDDDLLLKTAMENGATLESLAMGAVRFSREFTIRELQARWHSLLFDPAISEEASSRIIEFERSASTLSAGNSKDSKSLSWKRKSESVRSCYYAMRKRIRNEPFNSMDLDFLIAPNDSNCVGLEDKPLPGNPISDNIVVPETNVNVMHCSFPEIQESPHVLVEDQFLVESGSGTDELHESKEFHVNSLFQDNVLLLKPSSSFDQINNDPEDIFSESEGNQVFNSPILEWEWSIWRTEEGLSASDIPADGHGEKGLHEGDVYALPRDDLAKRNHASGHNDVTDSNVESKIPCEALANPTSDTEGYLMEITNTMYQHEDSKRVLIRLEKSSRSCTQRAIKSHGAFATLYDGHAYHYIKKPEILLGRTTEDFIVDIDLGRHNTNVSRRQAIINMKEDGSFRLKNLGKFSVYINGDPVAPGQSLSLNSEDLIMIREMAFTFATNKTCVKQYLNGVAEKKLSSGTLC